VERPPPYYILLFIRGVCVNYGDTVHLPMKWYERVKYGNVFWFNSCCYERCLNTVYILVGLLAVADVMAGIAV
jgi:hypothetical protein